ncbi:DoxX family membrane protein [Luteolibacter sp. AS25]|uniref:DoxX family protein n=1 Tax=Luteolibacter sp. AS25 TaxID=3135776 RepID=UPI00398A7E32
MNIRKISLYLLAVAFIIAGANHFRSPEIYISMIPPWLPAPSLLNVISGAAETAGGIGLLISLTRKAAAIGLILLLIAIFPANLHIAINGWPETGIASWILWARLPFQILFILWVAYSARITLYKNPSTPPSGTVN